MRGWYERRRLAPAAHSERGLDLVEMLAAVVGAHRLDRALGVAREEPVQGQLRYARVGLVGLMQSDRFELHPGASHRRTLSVKITSYVRLRKSSALTFRPRARARSASHE